MSKLRIRNGDWALVVDGRKALFLQNRGDGVHLGIVTREVREHPDLPNYELHTDRPGKVQQSAASFHSAVEVADRHEEAERVFIVDTLKRLDELLASDRSRRFVVIAPPRALGVIRKGYTSHLRFALEAEIDHDWLHLPVHEIEARLKELWE